MEDRHAHVRAMPFDVLARTLGIDIGRYKHARAAPSGPGLAFSTSRGRR
jgi:hypothetical protein